MYVYLKQSQHAYFEFGSFINPNEQKSS